MATYQKFEQFVEDLAHGVHDFSTDVLTVALCTNASLPIVTNSILGNLTEISYTNLSTRVITTNTSTQTSGTYELNLTDLVLTASGAVATFRWVVIYNETPTAPADPLIAFFDYGSDVTLANGETFTLDFSDANGLLQLT